MKQPIEPKKEDCCNSGCNPCIFDVYERQLKLYKKFLETGVSSSNEKIENALSQLEYTRFCLVKIDNICKSHKHLFFKRLSNSDGKKVLWNAGDHFLIKYNFDDNSCTRAFTPIQYQNEDGEFDFSIIVKVYQNGLVSKYLYELNIGDETLWRGPYGSYEVTPNKFKRILMTGQGTGIAPFIGIVKRILDDEDDFTKLILLYCAKDEESIILRDELYAFKDYWNFSYKIFLNEAIDYSKFKYKEPIVCHKLQSEDLSSFKPFSVDDQFLLCGSSNFMKSYEILLRDENIATDNIVLF